MPNRVNQLLVKQYKQVFDGVAAAVTIGYPGMKVNEVHALRGRLADKGCAVHFVRNNLIDIAFKELGLPSVADLCEEQTAFVISDDAVGMARFLVEVQREYKTLKLRGVYVDGTVVKGAAGVVALSQSPTKEELKSILSGQALRPAGNLSGAVLAAGANLASQIKKLSEPKEGETAA